MKYKIDQTAKDIAIKKWVLPECLHVPIGAVNELAIVEYIGEIKNVLSHRTPNRALLVKAKKPPNIDDRLPIWKLTKSQDFHHPTQVWVHIKYSRYRNAYKVAFPFENIDGKVMAHILNRRIAALKGFDYVRVTPISRGSNSSSGFSEKWGVGIHRSGKMKRISRNQEPFIQYADLSDLLVMMDIKIGGGITDVVNEAQKLVTFNTNR